MKGRSTVLIGGCVSGKRGTDVKDEARFGGETQGSVWGALIWSLTLELHGRILVGRGQGAHRWKAEISP